MSPGTDPILLARHVATPGGELEDAAVIVQGGVIQGVAPRSEVQGKPGLIDLGDVWLLPGLVDTHVHLNEPGRTQWEGFETGTRAAAAGGVTTLVDMPLNSTPATTDVRALEAKRNAARGRTHVDVGFWGGLVPGNLDQLEPLARAGVLGFKCFLVPSGVEDFAPVGEAELRRALPLLARLELPLLVHAELPGPIDEARAGLADRDVRRHDTWLASRPAEAEMQAIRMLIALSEEFGARVHVVHLAKAEALDDLRAARARGVPITVETCPHYLYFEAAHVPDGATQYKCAPPIRDAANRARLREAVRNGDIDLIATDHSPCPPDLKLSRTGDFMEAWGGIASLQVGLAAAWTALSDGEGDSAATSPSDLARWMSSAPAALAGLSGRKGAIAPGHDADFAVWLPETAEVVDAADLQHRHLVCPYVGERLRGRVQETWLRGRRVFARIESELSPTGIFFNPERGELLSRTPSLPNS